MLEGAASEGDAAALRFRSPAHTRSLVCCSAVLSAAFEREGRGLERAQQALRLHAVRRHSQSNSGAVAQPSPPQGGGRPFHLPINLGVKTQRPQTVLFTVANGRTSRKPAYTQHKAPLATKP
jgi:hypothetical protein